MGMCVGCRRELYPLIEVDPFTLERTTRKSMDSACCARLTRDGLDYEVAWCYACCTTDHTRSGRPTWWIQRQWWRFLDLVTGRYPWNWEKTHENDHE